VRGVNPAYALPKSVRFADAFAKVPLKVSFSMYPDETTELCDLVLPDLHALESWGDAESARGTIALQQPAMDPVFTGTRATADVLLEVARKDASLAARYPEPDFRSYLIKRWPGGGNAQTLGAALAKGSIAGSVAARTAPAAAAPVVNAPVTSTGDLFLVTYPSPTLGDG